MYVVESAISPIFHYDANNDYYKRQGENVALLYNILSRNYCHFDTDLLEKCQFYV